MILVASQRGGGGNLAKHLLNDRDNDHVAVQELRGFMGENLRDAFMEAEAIAKGGTKCSQYLFSLSLNPPKGAETTREDLIAAIDRAETALGLEGQPRAVVFHSKNGRPEHAHAVWSRIDPEEMKAVHMPFFKTKLNALSKELYLEHGWDLPEGHKEGGWKNPLNFTLAEFQQASRAGLDPRDIKQMFREAWRQSDNLSSLRAALEDHGYFLAKGDRRGVVAMDVQGEVFALARWAGVKTKDVSQRVPDPDVLPSVDDTRAMIKKRMTHQLRGYIREDRQAKQDELHPIKSEIRRTVTRQRDERTRLEQGQAQRRAREVAERASRFRRGLGGILDFVSGRSAATRNENETEAYQAYRRDTAQKEALFRDHHRERQPLQAKLEAMQKRHRQERVLLARKMTEAWRTLDRQERQQDAIRNHGSRPRGLDLER